MSTKQQVSALDSSLAEQKWLHTGEDEFVDAEIVDAWAGLPDSYIQIRRKTRRAGPKFGGEFAGESAASWRSNLSNFSVPKHLVKEKTSAEVSNEVSFFLNDVSAMHSAAKSLMEASADAQRKVRIPVADDDLQSLDRFVFLSNDAFG